MAIRGERLRRTDPCRGWLPSGIRPYRYRDHLEWRCSRDLGRMKPAHLTTRTSLLLRVRNLGDKDSWQEFFGIYQPLLYRYARARGLDRETADEVAQQCMVLLSKRMPTFSYSREKGGFKHWLHRLANNKISDYFRKKKLPNVPSSNLRQARQPKVSTDELWEREWGKKHMSYCLKQIQDKIAPTTYQAFRYHVIAGWSVGRVSEALNISPDQVYAAKSRITRKLRAKMRDLLGDEA